MQRHALQSPSIIVVGDVVQGARAWAQTLTPALAEAPLLRQA